MTDFEASRPPASVRVFAKHKVGLVAVIVGDVLAKTRRKYSSFNVISGRSIRGGTFQSNA